jgi:hypothetical protein
VRGRVGPVGVRATRGNIRNQISKDLRESEVGAAISKSNSGTDFNPSPLSPTILVLLQPLFHLRYAEPHKPTNLDVRDILLMRPLVDGRHGDTENIGNLMRC